MTLLTRMIITTMDTNDPTTNLLTYHLPYPSLPETLKTTTTTPPTYPSPITNSPTISTLWPPTSPLVITFSFPLVLSSLVLLSRTNRRVNLLVCGVGYLCKHVGLVLGEGRLLLCRCLYFEEVLGISVYILSNYISSLLLNSNIIYILLITFMFS